MRAVAIITAFSLILIGFHIAVSLTAGETLAWKVYVSLYVLLLIICLSAWVPVLRVVKPRRFGPYIVVSLCAGWLGGFLFFYCLAGLLGGFKSPVAFVEGLSTSLISVLSWSGIWIGAGAVLWVWSSRIDLQQAVEGDGPASGGSAP